MEAIARAKEAPNVPFVVVIEEINRGNPAQILGEMLTLLEADKRQEADALELSYRKDPYERVHIPPSRADLLSAWAQLYDQTPPRNISIGLLRRAVAHKLQEKACGGLRASTRRYLQKAAEGGRKVLSGPVDGASCTGTSVGVAVAPGALAPGSRLIREWNGLTYQVTVNVDGKFVMDGKTYTSLSAIAGHITGAAWSGPRFFGLVKVKLS